MSRERMEQTLKKLQEKLATYEYELLVTANPSLKFELNNQIEECDRQIKRIINRLKSDIAEPTPPTPKSNSSHQTFTFDTAKIEINGGKVDIIKSPGQAEYIEFDLDAAGKLEMVYIPAGSFVMGQSADEKQQLTARRFRKEDDQIGLLAAFIEEEYQRDYVRELPQHLVNVSAFYMGKYPITQSQYLAVMGSNPSRWQGGRLPVEQVSWHDANEFCEKLIQKTGKEFPVGSYQVANNFGLYDMHGNVWEWCLDHLHENYQGAPQDGSAWIDKNVIDRRCLLRGGSWSDGSIVCRSATRSYGIPGYRRDDIGFRVVCSPARILD